MNRKRALGQLLVAVCLTLVAANVAWAQPAGGRVPPPQDVTLATKDGVQLRITYYPSSAGQQAVPVVLLPDFNETRAVYDPLARALQNPAPPAEGAPLTVLPRAVVTVDLRGHGDSKTAFGPDGSSVELDANKFQVEDFQNMVSLDMETVRSFLVDRNDAGELNLNRLCVGGCGMGANVAVLWAAMDWATPDLAVRKQGKDVKALVLVSPRLNFRGLSLTEPLKYPPIQQNLSVYLAYGADDPKVAKDCESIAKVLTRYHPDPPQDQTAAKKDFFVLAAPTNLQGSELLTSGRFGLAEQIGGFIESRLGARAFPFVVRKR